MLRFLGHDPVPGLVVQNLQSCFYLRALIYDFRFSPVLAS